MRRVPRRKRPPDREDILRQLAELAFGKANDCVALAMLGDEAELQKLELSQLAGIKRGKDGSVEVRLIDRMQALKELAALCAEEDSPEALMRALCGEEK